jgi:hypothetical protein
MKYKLYVKRTKPNETHPKGYFYLGKSEMEGQKLESYLGSGKIWRAHLKKHGYKKEDIDTWILHETEDKQDLKNTAIYYSDLFDIVNSKEWANIRREEGDGGDTSMCPNYKKFPIHYGEKNWMCNLSEEWKTWFSDRMKGDKNPSKRLDVRDKISKAKKGKKNPKLSEFAKQRTNDKNPFYKKTHSEETRKIISEANKGRHTLEGYIKRYGDELGLKNYEETQKKKRDSKKGKPTWNKGIILEKFTCEICGIKIGGKSNLTRHINKHMKSL